MKRFTWIMTTLAALVMVPQIYADDIINSGSDISDDEMRAIRDWVNTKRQVTVKELGGNLSLSGEVRAEYQRKAECRDGKKQRGLDGQTGYPTNNYDVEVALMLDYRNDRSWAAIRLKFDNDAGIFNATNNKIRLDRAYFGQRLVAADSYTIDAEIGRRSLGSIFDSKIEFDANFDGILLRYDQSIQRVGDFYIHAGTFLVDEKVPQNAYVAEIGLINIADTGVYTKYSIIDWDTKHFNNNPIMNERFDYIVSQLVLGYKFLPTSLGKIVLLYSGALLNHKAHRLEITHQKKANWGAYLGFTIGQLRKKGDWAFDANYQAVAPQAVPEYDSAGIGIGNTNGSGFYTTSINGSGDPTTSANAGGPNNFRGFSLTWDILLTDNLALQQNYMQSATLYSSIGPFRTYKQYEMEMKYAF